MKSYTKPRAKLGRSSNHYSIGAGHLAVNVLLGAFFLDRRGPSYYRVFDPRQIGVRTEASLFWLDLSVRHRQDLTRSRRLGYTKLRQLVRLGIATALGN
jgi:hypothetical protein